jgi:hypothetical protein
MSDSLRLTRQNPLDVFMMVARYNLMVVSIQMTRLIPMGVFRFLTRFPQLGVYNGLARCFNLVV